MKITVERKNGGLWIRDWIKVEILDYEGQMKELQNILASIKREWLR